MTILTVLSFLSFAGIAQLILPPERKGTFEEGIYPEEKPMGKIRNIFFLQYTLQKDSATNGWVIPAKPQYGIGFKYDKNNNVIEKTRLNDNGEVEEAQKNYYDKLGRLTMSFEYQTNKVIDSIIYDETRHNITRFTSEFGKDNKRIYFFGKGNLLLKEENYSINGSLPVVEYTYEYDDKKRVTKEVMDNIGNIGISITYNGSTAKSVYPGYTYIYRYEENARYYCTKKFEKTNDTLILKEEFLEYKNYPSKVFKLYGNFGLSRMDSLIQDKNGFLLYRKDGDYSNSKYRLTYFDKNFRTLKMSREGLPGYTQTYGYVLDEKGNWIQEKTYNGKMELIGFRKRLIEYF